MHRSGGKPVVEQKVIDKVDVLFAVDKYEGTSGTQIHKEVVESLLLSVMVNPEDLGDG